MNKNYTLAPDRVEVTERIKKYEKQGGESFFLDVENDPPSRTILPDEVDYLQKRLTSKVKTAAACALEWVYKKKMGKSLNIKVVGGENMRAVQGGAIITSNHFATTENLAVKLASELARPRRKLYKVVREGNFFMPGTIGFLLKNCRTLPLSSNIHTMKKFDRAVSAILAKGDLILIYPEQAMWWNYKKPRDYRIGAYHYAAKNGVPVVPCFVTLSKNGKRGPDGYPQLEYTIHVMEQIRPDPSLTVRENAARMREENLRLCRKKYEEIYGIPLTYGDYEPDTEI